MKTSVMEMLDTLSDDDYVNVARVSASLRITMIHDTDHSVNKYWLYLDGNHAESHVWAQCAHSAPSCLLAVETLRLPHYSVFVLSAYLLYTWESVGLCFFPSLLITNLSIRI